MALRDVQAVPERLALPTKDVLRSAQAAAEGALHQPVPVARRVLAGEGQRSHRARAAPRPRAARSGTEPSTRPAPTGRRARSSAAARRSRAGARAAARRLLRATSPALPRRAAARARPAFRRRRRGRAPDYRRARAAYSTSSAPIRPARRWARPVPSAARGASQPVHSGRLQALGPSAPAVAARNARRQQPAPGSQ